MSFIAGYMAAGAALGAKEAADRGEDPVQGAVDGFTRVGRPFVWLWFFLIWGFLAAVVNSMLIERAEMPPNSMRVFLLSAFLVALPVILFKKARRALLERSASKQLATRDS